MTALFDSGNSRLHFSWWVDGNLKDPVSISYPETIDELEEIINNFFCGKIPQNMDNCQESVGNKDYTIHKIAACSVSSQWREVLFKSIDRNAPGKLVVARTAYDIGINVAYEKPETIGVDRVLAAYAAHRFFNEPCIVIDAGTAVTVDAVAGDVMLAGGYIFPGIDVLSWSLSTKTALPRIFPADICEGIGNSTETCISFGLQIGFSGAVTALVNQARAFAGGTDRIVVTGGGAEKVMSCLPFPAVYRPYLVLEGLGYNIDTLPEYEL